MDSTKDLYVGDVRCWISDAGRFPRDTWFLGTLEDGKRYVMQQIGGSCHPDVYELTYRELCVWDNEYQLGKRLRAAGYNV